MTSLLEDQILKSDRRGRVRVPVERREALLEEYERGGVSAAKFAEMVGVKYSTFANWAQKRRQGLAGGDGSGKSEGAGKPIRLVEAMVEANGVVASRTVAGALVVELPGGARMQVESESQVRLSAQLLVAVAQAMRASC